jgi:NAD(P)-dependent dehydrogenase (short-subunit alcohol dehydrogenase family)
MYCMRSELQNMKNKGSIINASSVAGVAGFPKNAAYTAAKHAVIGLSRTAAKEVSSHLRIPLPPRRDLHDGLYLSSESTLLTNLKVGEREIRVNCISPGVIDTPMHRASNVTRGKGNEDYDFKWAIKRKGQANEVAALIAWLLCDSSSYITGTVQVGQRCTCLMTQC